MAEIDSRPTYARAIWSLLLAAVALVAVFGVLALHQFYPDDPIVRWLWIFLWLVVYPLLLVGCLLLARKRQRGGSQKHDA